MAINVASGSYGYNNTGFITAVPLTISGWIKPSSSGTNRVFASIGDSGSTNDFWAIRVNSTNKAEAFTRGSSNAIATGTTTISSGSIYHVCGVFASNASRTIYVNGASEATNTTSQTPNPVNINRTALGARPDGGLSFSGDIWEVAYWNVVLDASEIAALGKGFSPKFIRPSGLIEYYPCRKAYSPIRGVKGNYDLTHSGTISDAIHGRIIYPYGLGWAGFSAFVPPVTNKFIFLGCNF